ncbi:MAG: YdeI/OmpD-associated family protein [Caldilineaceae bacterium]|nr:YdeI/OmpD-associated family protein [Caldilineaceae bacterium]
MNHPNPKVDPYFIEGCGRCALVGTPECKVHTWEEELAHLRRICLDSDLTEELKWSQPCYTVGGRNLIMIAAFKDNCVLSFFKGALLKDPHGILEKPGGNSRAGRVVRFTDVAQVLEQEPILKAYIEESIAAEKAGLEVVVEDDELVLPEELEEKFAEDPDFMAAFEALTPGRQRGYAIYFSSAKQSKTRTARIEKHMPRIFEGLGMHDR